jgi:hypothetical protein
MSVFILATFPGKEDLVVDRAKRPRKIETASEALIELSELSYNQPKLRRVCDAIKEADAPLFDRIREVAKANHRKDEQDEKSVVKEK